MPWTRRSDRHLERVFRNGQHIERPAVLDRPGRYYESSLSRIPERVRLSFSDGTTAVYQLMIELPAPVFRETKHDIVGFDLRLDVPTVMALATAGLLGHHQFQELFFG